MPTQEQGKSEAKQKAEQVKGEAQHKAQQATGKAQSRLREQFDQRSGQAGERLKSDAHDLHSVSDQLRKQGKDKPAEYVDKACQKAEQLGDYLEQADADRVLHDVEDFGRREPAVLAGGALALGFAASRFLKASSSKRHQQQHQQQQRAGQPAADVVRAGTALPAAGPAAGEPMPPRAGEPLEPPTAPPAGVPAGAPDRTWR